MIIGDPNVFALESEITIAYDSPGLRALGCFVIHLSGRPFGVRAPDATLLACSFDEVVRRIRHRGEHTATFADADALGIATSFRHAVYQEEAPLITAVGIPPLELAELLNEKHLVWAPDGDEAFDDGSYVLHLDTPVGARLVGFKCHENGLPDPATLSDLLVPADHFYSVLAEWIARFEDDWRRTAKAST